MKVYRAWISGEPESPDFAYIAPCAEIAAADMVKSRPHIDQRALAATPLLVLVADTNGAVHRCLVTSETETTVWGYPADAETATA